MAKRKKLKLPRSPLPKQTGGPHKSPKDYDRRKWKEVADDETSPGPSDESREP